MQTLGGIEAASVTWRRRIIRRKARDKKERKNFTDSEKQKQCWKIAEKKVK